MFPNPQAALPLPANPDPEQYKKLAKDRVRACKSGKPEAIQDWASAWIATLVRHSGLAFTPGLPVESERWVAQVADFARRRLLAGKAGRKCALADAQFVV